MHELLLKNITKQIDLTPEEEKLITSKFNFQKVKNKEVLIDFGDTSSRTYFVTNGCLRAFARDNNGVEHTISFAPADWWIGEMSSYISGEPATLSIDAIEKSEVLFIDKDDYEKLFRDIPKLETVFRKMLERSVVAYQKRLIDNLSKTAEERYVNFSIKFPQLVNTIPQKIIASFIGVTPEFFSKMKASMLKRK